MNDKRYKGNLRSLMQRFSYGKKETYKDGDWSVSVGGYDLWFEVYLEDVPVFSCIGGFVKFTGAKLSKEEAKKYAKIIVESYKGIDLVEDLKREA